eukprot:TRINITY_DN13533_c0_g1_i2.p1 TRINITY_DN13533_c0_g1~~TRINITY_DN13533_c0_g1_i2.p1  ORF type:complete len:210 (+),score=5.52 TRINITY_DN13533_c0_g1_i2:379-1008(+)
MIDFSTEFGALWEYIKVNFRNPIVRRGSIKLFLKDQVVNIIGIAQLFMTQYMVDSILLPKGAASRPEEVLVALCTVALIILAFRGITHFLAFRASFWRVGGASRKYLMTNLLKTWLAYDVAVTAQLVPPSTALRAIRVSSMELVDLGYMQIFPVVRDVVNLFFSYLSGREHRRVGTYTHGLGASNHDTLHAVPGTQDSTDPRTSTSPRQ